MPFIFSWDSVEKRKLFWISLKLIIILNRCRSWSMTKREIIWFVACTESLELISTLSYITIIWFSSTFDTLPNYVNYILTDSHLCFVKHVVNPLDAFFRELTLTSVLFWRKHEFNFGWITFFYSSQTYFFQMLISVINQVISWSPSLYPPTATCDSYTQPNRSSLL